MLRYAAYGLVITLLLAAPALADEAGHAHDDHEDHAEHADHADDENGDHVAHVGDIEILHAWSRATDGDHAELFMEITNEGEADDTLVGASSEIASEAVLVGAVLEAGERVEKPIEALTVKAGGELDLVPNVVFIHLEGLSQPLKEGDEFHAELQFENAGTAAIVVEVEAADASQHSHAGHAH
ncbi:MAG: copper chaperone PCu(A)C [Geminicoccaceae bacterium]